MNAPSRDAATFVGPGGSDFGARNAVLTARASNFHCAGFAGPLSLKWVGAGSATWDTGDARYVVHDEACLLLDEGRRYALSIASPRPVETLSVFFRRGFVEDALRAYATPAARLLDAPDAHVEALRFGARMHPGGGAVGLRMAALRAALGRRAPDAEALDDALHGLARVLVGLHCDARRLEGSLPAARASTRVELARRLYRARDFIEASLGRRVVLEEAARAACLSTHHFHRLFTGAFGETPHRYATRRRLERAGELLARTRRPVSDVCADVGFESLGSFSTLFRRTYGASPREYRASRSAAAPSK